MFDIRLRDIKDGLFMPCCGYIPNFFTPLQLTAAAFLSGMISAYFAARAHISWSLCFWLLNRTLDCLDGTLARHRGTASDLGGFLDLLGDFIVYSLLPIAVATSNANSSRQWPAVAFLEASFHVNNFVLFYVAAVAEKKSIAAKGHSEDKAKEITSVTMKPALIEGAESATFFTAMLAFPKYIEVWSWTMACLVAIGTAQRVFHIVPVLR
ncbi:MAG: hypothetical protein Q9225_005558 [Loekoesia sp. 1 TL-2023]